MSRKIVPVDKWKWVLHALFGAVFGAALGFAAWLKFGDVKSTFQMLAVPAAFAILIGILAAYKLDDFWTSIKGDGSFKVDPWQ